ncbi:MAG: type II 3-dehydroquinate dehydratase [bacterium]|jgi:3-dehydroquinate dehydratase-2
MIRPGMVRVAVFHGANINLLGVRDPDVYGKSTFDEVNRRIKDQADQLDLEVKILQSNHEGAIIDAIHDVMDWADVIIINPGAFTHYSYGIREALAAVRLPVIEVHLSNIHSRPEEWRHHSVISPITMGQVIGFGGLSYLLALQAAKAMIEETRT